MDPDRRRSGVALAACVFVIVMTSCDSAVRVEIVNPCGEPIEVLLWGGHEPPAQEALEALTFIVVEGERSSAEVIGTGWPGGLVFVRSAVGDSSPRAIDVPADRTIEIPSTACPQ